MMCLPSPLEPLSVRIEKLVIALLGQLSRAREEFDRTDLPEDWMDDLEAADEAAGIVQSALEAKGEDISDALDKILQMVGRIEEHDDPDDEG